MEEKSKSISTLVWPGGSIAKRRWLIITAVLLPLSWAVYAFCEDSWAIKFGDGESLCHLVEWILLLGLAVVAVFFASLLPFFGWLRRLLDWAGSGRIAKRIMKSGIWVVTAVALFHAEEDWRGSRAWHNYRDAMEPKGEEFNLAAFVPKTVPDELNFAATPVVKSWFQEVDRKVFTNTTERFVKNWQDNYENVIAQYPGTNQQSSRQFMDLATWGADFDAIRDGRTNLIREPRQENTAAAARAAAAPAVLAGLKTNETTMMELEAASHRPLSRYPVVYDLDNPWGIMLPHLANMRDACRRLQLRACAELAAGRSGEALADIKLMFYLADSVKEEPFLISYVVRAACVQMAVQPVWEGLAGHAWPDQQLQELEARCQEYDFIADAARPLKAERTAGILTAELVRKKRLGFLIELIGPGQPTVTDKRLANWVGAMIPRGWYYQEQANYCRLYQQQLEGVFDAAGQRVAPGRVEANQKEIARELTTGSFGNTVNGLLRHRAIASLILPSLDQFSLKVAAAQTASNQAALACALERYRLANGRFPESLDALEPKFISQLPGDVIAGKPMNYQRTSDGQFLLYSVGWNEKDDGGTPGKTLFDDKQGDWVWEYPAS